MKRFFIGGMMTLALCSVPATCSASTIFSLVGFTAAGSSSGVGTATINFQGINYGSTITENFQEVYTWNSGSNTATLVFTAVNANATTGFTAGETILTVNEAGTGNLLPNNSPSAVNLFAGVTSMTFASNFATDLGLGSTTPNPAAFVTSNFSDTASGGTVSSAVAQLISTPEPSTLAMAGLSLLLACGIKFGRKHAVTSARS